MAGNVIAFPLVGVEDCLLNIGALTKFALFALENTEEHEFLRLRSELVTMFYMIRDQVDAGHGNMSAHARSRKNKGE